MYQGMGENLKYCMQESVFSYRRRLEAVMTNEGLSTKYNFQESVRLLLAPLLQTYCSNLIVYRWFSKFMIFSVEDKRKLYLFEFSMHSRIPMYNQFLGIILFYSFTKVFLFNRSSNTYIYIYITYIYIYHIYIWINIFKSRE